MAKTGLRLARDEFDLSAPLARTALAQSREVESIIDATGGLGVALGIARPLDLSPAGSFALAAPRLPSISGPPNPSFTDQVGFLNALNPNGSLDTDPNNSYWEFSGETARKWDTPTAGTSATVKYFFDPSSGFSANEENTFLKAFGLWEAVADITFVEANTVAQADVLLTRGNDGSAYFLGNTTNGSGSTLGSYVGQTLISVDDSTFGFELTGSFVTAGGYGLSTVIHEVGHMIGLGHGGFYNGAVNPATQQYSAFDERQWTIMSYIYWNQAGTAKFGDEYTVTGTNWGVTEDSINRQAPHTWMPVDILAAQWLYGESTSNALNGGDTFGFNSNIGGIISDFFDFTVNDHPVITLFSLGTGNTLDASGFSEDAFIDLRPLGFSSLNGHVNNVVIADGTVIETGIGGSGKDTIQGGDGKNKLLGKDGADQLLGGGGKDDLSGGAGKDKLEGEGGNDTFRLTSDKAADADKIVDFGGEDKVSLLGSEFGLAPGALKASAFELGTAATSDKDRIIYDQASGKLWFDEDGTGAAAKVLIATFQNNAVLASTDFIVV
ncbi:MAG: M10 family metallopeptidase C-terminal domain-containing protein [Sphingomonadaceae bacterium]|nr:M10 family metallopeptidase C-terminal domain-containing protein [Sphingomonadaceae bacterium]